MVGRDVRMKTFNQFLTELFDRPYPFKMVKYSSTEWQYEFYTNDNKKYIVIMMYYQSTNRWEVLFADEKGEIEITGKGGKEVSSIFATVMVIIRDFIKNKSPDVLYFSADKGEGKSRSRLYTTLVKTQTPSGYDYSIDEKPTTTYFTLEKK